MLYVCSILPNEWEEFLAQRNGKFSKEFILNGEQEISVEYLTLLWEFIQTHPYEHHKHRYDIRSHKIAAVMSCGKNFTVWKTAGREIPW